MKVNKFTLFFALCFYSILTVFFLDGSSNIVSSLFLLVMFQNLYFLFIHGVSGFSIYKVYFIFNFVFFSYIPYLHYSEGIVFWGGDPPVISDYVIALTYLILFNSVVGFMYNYRIKTYLISPNYSSSESEFKSVFRKDGYRVSNFLIFISVSLVAFISLYMKGFNFYAIFFKGVSNEDAVIVSSSTDLVVSRFTMFFPMFAFIVYATFNPKRYLSKSYLFICVLLCAFPLAISRFAVAAIYMPILLFTFRRLMQGQTMTLGLIGSICYVFPFLDQFRHYKDDLEISFLPEPSFFYAGHFDSFQNLLAAISSEFITYGDQLLGVFLFFIPRTYWPDKPVGSGAQLAENLGYTFSNISMPFAAEAYVNFGILGGLFMAASLAIFMRKLDVLYWSGRYKSIYYPILYFFVISFMTFILRGDLLSSFAYLIGGVFSFLCAKYIYEFGRVIRFN